MLSTRERDKEDVRERPAFFQTNIFFKDLPMNIQQISRTNSTKAQMIYHENPDVFHVNTMANHCYFVPFAVGLEEKVFLFLRALRQWSVRSGSQKLLLHL